MSTFYITIKRGERRLSRGALPVRVSPEAKLGHLAKSKAHRVLREQLDRYPLGAPGETLIHEILGTIYTEEEAHLAASLPLGFSSLPVLSKRLKIPEVKLQKQLDRLADKGLVLDMNIGGTKKYALPPTLVGLFEFSMMRIRDDFDQKQLAGLYHRYLVEEPTYFSRIAGNDTTPFRTMVHEETLPADYTEILDYERVTRIIERESLIAVGICHCRHVALHLDRECALFPLESCISFGEAAAYLMRRGFARKIDKKKAREMVALAKKKGMVHIGDNVQSEPNYLCNCCACCCEVLASFRNFDFFLNTFSSNFEARSDTSLCNGCKACLIACPVNAIQMEEAGVSRVTGKTMLRAQVDDTICLGCGVCVPKCPKNAMQMVPRPQKHLIPEDTIARTLMMAVENGTLQEMLVDRHQGMSSAAIAGFVGALLKLPPAKQLLAKKSVKSRFVRFLAKRV